jgi:hypothetical protein
MHDSIRSPRFVAIGLGVAVLLAPPSGRALGAYTIAWSTADYGGGGSDGGPYALQGTAGQLDAGHLAGGAYQLLGGFQAGHARSPADVSGDVAKFQFGLGPPVPHPLGRSGRIPIEIPRGGHAEVKVFDLSGSVAATLFDGSIEAGRHELRWTGLDDTGRPLPSGVYFLRLQQDSRRLTRKLVVAR